MEMRWITLDPEIRKEVSWEVFCDYITYGFGNMNKFWQSRVTCFINRNFEKIWHDGSVNRKLAKQMMRELLEAYEESDENYIS